MKKITYFIIPLATVLVCCVLPITAQTKTPTQTVTDAVKAASPSAKLSPTTAEDKQVVELKNKVADKVAELSKQNKKAISGFVTELKDDQIKIKSDDEKIHIVKIDSVITKFFQITAGAKKEAKQSAIEKSDYIIVSGPQIADTVTANVVYVDERLEIKSGKITEVNTDDNTFKMLSTDKENIAITLSKSAKLSMINTKTLEVEKTTMSKIKEGDTVHVVYQLTDDFGQTPAKVTVRRVLVIPQEYFMK